MRPYKERKRLYVILRVYDEDDGHPHEYHQREYQKDDLQLSYLEGFRVYLLALIRHPLQLLSFRKDPSLSAAHSRPC